MSLFKRARVRGEFAIVGCQRKFREMLGDRSLLSSAFSVLCFPETLNTITVKILTKILRYLLV